MSNMIENISTTNPSKKLCLVRSSELSPNHVSIGSHAGNTSVDASRNYATHIDLITISPCIT